MSTVTPFFILMVLCLISCTFSMQNISTHGTATDLVDEEQCATADISPKVRIPLK